MRNRIPLCLGDVLVGVLLLAMIGTACVVAVADARETANRAKCASNLHQIGLAIILYQNDNQQSYPYTVRGDGQNPKPVWGTPYQTDKDLGPTVDANAYKGGKTAPAANDVTAALYQLMLNEQITSAVFACPSSTQDAWGFGGGANNASNWTNWQGNEGISDHLSYSFQNEYASNAAVAAGFQMKNPDATFAVAADMNPGGAAVTSVTIQSLDAEMRKANSPNHQQDGQNVLYGDGHVAWVSTPFCGTMNDNIFTAGGSEVNEPERKTAAVIASPVSATDSILLPTAADISPSADLPAALPVTADQIAALQKELQGHYTATISGAPWLLSIGDKTFTFTSEFRKIQFPYTITAAAKPWIVLTMTSSHGPITCDINQRSHGIHLKLETDSALNRSWQRE